MNARKAQKDADPHLTEDTIQKKEHAIIALARTTMQAPPENEVQDVSNLHLHALSTPKHSKSILIASEGLLLH